MKKKLRYTDLMYKQILRTNLKSNVWQLVTRIGISIFGRGPYLCDMWTVLLISHVFSKLDSKMKCLQIVPVIYTLETKTKYRLNTRF